MRISMKKNVMLLFLNSLVILHLATPSFAEDSIVVNEISGKKHREGLNLYNQGNYLHAIPHFEEAYQLDERNIAALFAHGLALNKIKRHSEAAEIFKTLLEKDPLYEKALKMYPTALAQAGQTEQALDAYDKGITQMPNDYYFYLGKARVYIELKNFNDAISYLTEALDIDSQRSELHETIAYAYRGQELFGEALSHYNKALELRPRDINYQFLRAQTLADMGRMEDAYNAAMNVLERNKNHARARIIIANYKRLAGKLNEALEEYTIAAKNIETKAYAEYYIEVIKQQLDEIEIEKEYEARPINR